MPCILKAQSNQTVTAGSATTAVNFPGGICNYSWTNDNPVIGLPTAGIGNIPPFITINNTTTPLIANVAATPIGFSYVPNSKEGTVTVINPKLQITNTITTGKTPIGVAISGDGSRVYVTDMSTGTISFIDAATGTISSVVSGASAPTGIAITPDGNDIYVANSGSNDVWKINTATQLITPITIGHKSQGMLISPDGTKIYAIYAGGISVISTANNTVLANIITTTSIPTSAVISRDGKHIYMTENTSANLISIDLVNNTSQTAYFGGLSSNGVAISPDGTTLYQTLTDLNIIVVINAIDYTEISVIGSANQASGSSASAPSSLSVSPDGRLLYVTYNNNNNGNNNTPGSLSIINISNSSVVANIEVGIGPIPLGNFVKSTGCPTIDFTITVNPIIGPSPVSTVYGTPSLSSSFIVNGTSIAGGIKVTAPAAFEISSDDTTFTSGTLVLGGATSIDSLPVYIRLKQTTVPGTYLGDIVVTSSVSSARVAMPASTVMPAPLIIIADDVTKIYGNVLTGKSGSTDFSVTGLKNAETISSVIFNYGNGAAASAITGNYNGSVIPSSAGGKFATNYSITYQPGKLMVVPATLTVTADNKSKFNGDVNPALTVTYTGFVNNEGVAQLTTLPIVSTTATQASAVGTYPITVSGGSAANYTLNYMNGVLTVNPAQIIIPNTFTPNGDGINDTWNITNLYSYPKTTVEVLNRYGSRVYFSNNYPVAWDGKHKGTNVPAGTYYYIITGVNAKPITGYVVVIR